MNSEFPFTKMAGTGNDFIMIDNRRGLFAGDEQAVFNALCQRRTGAGADGLILLEEGTEAPARMRYYNRDGLESDMCGNGARCAAYLARQWGMASGDAFVLQARDGLHPVRVEKDRVSLQMTAPRDWRDDFHLETPAFLETGATLNTGVAHLVFKTPDVDAVDVRAMAPPFRHHAEFEGGVNVNFVQVQDKNRIRVRTFEKGVEEETLSCGTGCVASALIGARKWHLESPVKVETRGGFLEVDFDVSWKRVFLKGPVTVIYDARCRLFDPDGGAR